MSSSTGCPPPAPSAGDAILRHHFTISPRSLFRNAPQFQIGIVKSGTAVDDVSVACLFLFCFVSVVLMFSVWLRCLTDRGDRPSIGACLPSTGLVQAGDHEAGQDVRVVRGPELDAPGVAESEADDHPGRGDLLVPADAHGQPRGQRQQHRGPAPEGEWPMGHRAKTRLFGTKSNGLRAKWWRK